MEVRATWVRDCHDTQAVRQRRIEELAFAVVDWMDDGFQETAFSPPGYGVISTYQKKSFCQRLKQVQLIQTAIADFNICHLAGTEQGAEA